MCWKKLMQDGQKFLFFPDTKRELKEWKKLEKEKLIRLNGAFSKKTRK